MLKISLPLRILNMDRKSLSLEEISSSKDAIPTLKSFILINLELISLSDQPNNIITKNILPRKFLLTMVSVTNRILSAMYTDSFLNHPRKISSNGLIIKSVSDL
jgi:hypothetical protein